MTHVEQTARAQNAAREERTLDALRSILATPAGRTLHNFVEDSAAVWSDAPAAEADRAAWIGRRALGLFLLRAFREADHEACLMAERERRAMEAREADEIAEARRLDEQETSQT